MRAFLATALSALLLGSAGCGGSTPYEPPKVPPPPELAYDAATKAAATDKRFDSFKKEVRALRGLQKQFSEIQARLRSGKATDADRQSLETLDASMAAALQSLNASMEDASRSDEDRKTMRYLFAAPAAELGG